MAGTEVKKAVEGAVELALVAGFVTEVEVEGAGVVGKVADGEGGAGGRVVNWNDAAHGVIHF